MCIRGEVWYAKLPIVKGSRVQGGFRPVLIVGNDLQSKKSPTIRIIPLTTEFKRMDLPFHIVLESECLLEPSIALVEQEHLIDRNCLREKWGNLSEKDMNDIDVCRFFQGGFKMSIFNTINATNGKQSLSI